MGPPVALPRDSILSVQASRSIDRAVKDSVSSVIQPDQIEMQYHI